ncbi:hypothetical protein RAS1_30870 [Phycisphaerae bacterium RAS1]|nr:hypothetical protein RAS1_30870 [Phycisphaerae bacterium RAS1]
MNNEKPSAVAAAAAPAAASACAVNRLVTFAHVVDVQTSVAFYALLGFSPESVLKDSHGCMFWARLRSDKAEIMFARASGPVDPTVQAVLFYMYSRDVAGLRRHLLENGLHDGGRYCGQEGPNGGRRVTFEITHPDYMPAGEFRVAEPDGYCILIGQLG